MNFVGLVPSQFYSKLDQILVRHSEFDLESNEWCGAKTFFLTTLLGIDTSSADPTLKVFQLSVRIYLPNNGTGYIRFAYYFDGRCEFLEKQFFSFFLLLQIKIRGNIKGDSSSLPKLKNHKFSSTTW